jgi:hypothetical protein
MAGREGGSRGGQRSVEGDRNERMVIAGGREQAWIFQKKWEIWLSVTCLALLHVVARLGVGQGIPGGRGGGVSVLVQGGKGGHQGVGGQVQAVPDALEHGVATWVEGKGEEGRRDKRIK